jgi:hypothetical protein
LLEHAISSLQDRDPIVINDTLLFWQDVGGVHARSSLMVVCPATLAAHTASSNKDGSFLFILLTKEVLQ